MKKCIHCGREIPDDAAFCGFCGTPQPKEDNHSEGKQKETEETSESDKAEEITDGETTDSSSEKNEVKTNDSENNPEETKSSDAQNSITDGKTVNSSSDSVEKKPENPDEEKDTVPDSAEETHEIKDAEIVDSSSEKKEEEPEEADESEEASNDENEDQDSATDEKEKKKHVNLKKISLPKINVSKDDFSRLLEILEKPDENHGIDNTTTWIILIFAWIASWVAFGSFAKGFFSLLIVLIGMILMNWLALKDHATFGETVRNSAEVIFAPSVLVFAGGLFIRNIRAGAEVYAFHSVFTTAFIGLFFLTAALILFLYSVIKKYEMKVWQIVLILTVFVSLLFWYLLTGGAISLLY